MVERIHFDRSSLNRIFKLLILAVSLVLLTWYGLFQARFLIAGPQIHMDTPVSTVQEKRIVSVTGSTKNTTSITLNGRPITIDETGIFTEALVLQDGYTIMELRATDRYGRSVTYTHPLIYNNPLNLN